MEIFGMLQKLVIIFSILIALNTIEVSAQTAIATNTTDHGHPFVKQAELIYKKSLDAETRGDVELFKRTRTNAAVVGTLANLKRMEKSESDLSSMLKKVAVWQTDISQFTFVRCDAKDDIARLLYRRDGKNEMGPTVEFAVFMIQSEGGVWRIGWVGNTPGPKIFMGKERTEDEIIQNPRFALK